MPFKHDIRKLIWKTGFDVSRFTPGESTLARRRELFRLYEIDLVLDVGANTGQFAQELRRDFGYKGRIVSFEPMGSEFAELSQNSKGDPLWETHNYALGDTDGKSTINIAANSLSSSLLEMDGRHLEAAPGSKYVDTQEIELRKLDSVFADIHRDESSVFLKVDTQGFEDRVLKGAENSLRSIDTVQVEMSIVPVYENEVLFSDFLAVMADLDYRLASLNEVFWNEQTGELLQVDGLFHRPRKAV